MDMQLVHERLQGPVPTRRYKATPVIKALRAFFRVGGRVAPGMMGKLAYRLWFTPMRHKRPEAEAAFLKTAGEAFTLTSGGERISCHAWGEGPTVLLIHGWEGRGSQMGQFVEPLRAKGYRVVCFDAPAHGDSTGKQTDVLAIREVLAELERRESGLAGVISHSFGAVSAAYAHAQGMRPERMVFICPPSQFETMLAIFQAELAIPDKAMNAMIRRTAQRFPQLGEGLWKAIRVHENARGFEMPGLIIHDVDDAVVPISEGRLVADTWADAEFIETNGLGHRRILKDAGVIKRIVDFFGDAA